MGRIFPIFLLLIAITPLIINGAFVIPRFLCSTAGGYAIDIDDCNGAGVQTTVPWYLYNGNGVLINSGNYLSTGGQSYSFNRGWATFNIASTSYPLTFKMCGTSGCNTTLIPCWSPSDPTCNALGLAYGCDVHHTSLAYNYCSAVPSSLISLSQFGQTTLSQGYYLKSLNGEYNLLMQNDGNLVAYFSYWGDIFAPATAFWSTGTNGQGVPPYRLVMQTDSNLVLRDANNNAIWNIGIRSSAAPFWLDVQNDKNIVTYDSTGWGYWASNT